MKTFGWSTVIALLLAAFTLCIEGAKPIPNIKVILRGKKYDIKDVTTVDELKERLSEASGVDPSRQGRVLFNGKRLDGSVSLSDVGVEAGAQLNVVPGKAKSKNTSTVPKPKSSGISSATSSTASSADSPLQAAASNTLKNMLAGSGMDTSYIEELMQKMSAPTSNDPRENMKQSMELISNLMDSPMFKEFLADSSKLEQVRQMILANPMLKGMMTSMPGIEEILNSPEIWRQAIRETVKMYKSMDPDTILNMAMSQAGDMGMGLGGDMFGGMTGMGMGGSGTSLDELPEDD